MTTEQDEQDALRIADDMGIRQLGFTADAKPVFEIDVCEFARRLLAWQRERAEPVAKTPAQRYAEADINDEEAFEKAKAENDAYVGSLEYRGNTVSYLVDKGRHYGDVVLEAHKLSGAKSGQNVLDRIRELVAPPAAPVAAQEGMVMVLREMCEGARELPAAVRGRKLHEALINADTMLSAAPAAQDALDARLPFVVEYMRKDGGHGWIPMAAFDQQRIAENYAQSCRGDNIPWEYRVVDAAMRGKEERHE